MQYILKNATPHKVAAMKKLQAVRPKQLPTTTKKKTSQIQNKRDVQKIDGMHVAKRYLLLTKNRLSRDLLNNFLTSLSNT